MSMSVSRRTFFAATAATVAANSLVVPKVAPAAENHVQPFRYCLNTSTIRECSYQGKKIDIVSGIEVTSKAGYTGIEPWIGELDTYVKGGGSLSDLRKRISDAGLTVESAIGFAAFLHEDENERKKGLEEAKRCMGLVREIGGTRIAAPPVGVTDKTGLDPFKLAERYRALCEVGQAEGVLPQLELWGFAKTLHRMGEVAFIGVEAAHPAACCLLDIYHIYKGGSDFEGLGMFASSRMHNFHVNDYPGDPPRDTINDSQRVYPGDGVAPLGQIFRTLRDNGYRGVLSLELFNRTYWQQDAFQVAKTGLEKTQAAVAKALG
ncbi:sugar phosphate isomerase/epimerase family protein [Schlesneria paludicola]|uniref:sugar phosphate isomerase/epimerase family protein n=1 Tax=Schlesneria paludicola TaxID=360056 RepID=UPI00029A03C9|nr:sugar phosphate isomerase/epimerase [Schlesneria paludicola]